MIKPVNPNLDNSRLGLGVTHQIGLAISGVEILGRNARGLRIRLGSGDNPVTEEHSACSPVIPAR